MAKQIKAIIPLKGISEGKRQISFEADGFVGESCRDATKIFTDALGPQTDETVKDEMYDVEQRNEFLQDGGAGG